MDIFKGIGDFFGGLFGQKKKREDEQPQQQSAVSFNSTPKLGDNFANNLSNSTQPQQPKEFAKSSVDLNPVKPVQPVQPQPQMNREQERQQLANKYRQEETDRYNQGSDHVANFLNDVFSGGKTAQMRENTINQNIQNRVNAEMLRKYGPDDQQVKQNIAQTSQDINRNASAVNNFTKNYNNNVQQTVSAPVSAVKGAVNTVGEFVPKTSGAVTELGANTIKLFDEDNQFANNLINRVRADREKNIVRKTLNSATGLTDQDNKMAYGLGSSGTRMAIDAAMTPVTGGVAPALVHGVEAHSDMMDHLDNIEARKKAEAAAKGEIYTPSSFGARYLASTANAGAQAAIEKLGIDNITGKIGGKFAKNMVGRAVTGALGEAGEEGAQQYAENFTKKLFDNKQNIHEGVAESALMGGIMGGAGKMAFGGMESVKNPYKSNTSYDPKALIEAERNAVRTGLFNKNNANSDLSLADAEFNVGAPERLAKALRNGADGDVSFMRMPNRLLGEVNTIRQNIGQNPLKTNEITAYKNAVNNHLNKRVLEGMSPETVAHIAADSFINPYSKALPVENNGAYDRNHIQMAVSGNPDGKYNTTTFSQFGDNISLKNITPRKSAEIKNLLQRREEILNGSSDGGAGVVPSSTDVGGAPFSAGRTTYTDNIARNTQKVNRMQPFEPTEHTPLANGDRDFGGLFGNGFDPRGENSQVNKIIDRPDGSRYVEIDNNIINGLQRKTDIQKAVKNHISENFQGNQYQIGDTGEYTKVTKKTKNEITHQQKIMSDIDYAIKARMAGNLNDLIETMSDVRAVANKKPQNKPNVSHYLSGRTEVNIDGEVYYPRVDIEVNNQGNVVAYDIADIKRSKKIEPRSEQYDDRSYIRKANSVLDNQGSAYGSNIAQKDQKVNNGYQYSDEIRNKIDQNLDERLLHVRDNTGENLADLEARLKREGATEQEIEPYKNRFIRLAKIFLEEPGAMPEWSLDQENTQNNETNLSDFNFQPSAINENTKLYHGTNGKVAEEIRKNGFKRGNELDENAYFGGGYDVRDQDSVSFSTNRKVSETFAINGRDSGKGSGALIEARLLPGARVVETDAEIYAEDLNEVTEQLRKQGVDAVFLKSNGEDELVVLNPEKVDRNILIERYKLANQQKQALTAKLEDLKARHQNLTGDEDLVFNIFKDELQKNALGYFDPKTNQINLNDLTFETLNHEIGHKIFSRVPLEQKADLIGEVRKTFGDEALIQQYGKDYGDDLNLLAEEKLADGFSDYYQGRLNGEESTRLGAKLGIPPKILAYYDRMIEAIKSVFGATNELKKFYAEIETGKFAQDYKQNTPVYNESPAFKIAQDSKGDLVEIDQNIFEGVAKKDRSGVLKKYLQDNLQGNEYSLHYGEDGEVKITRTSVNKLSNPKQSPYNLNKKGQIISELPDILTISQKTGWAPDGKDHSFARDGFEYRQSRVKLGDEVYTVNLNVGLSQSGKVLYEINGIKKEVAHIRSDLIREPSSNGSIISNDEDSVNTSGSEKRYLLNSTPETNQKTRKFAETVLDTDTPPKDFVKLMHAGDESLKYTPKKNSEMWNRAAKSVQESPERVFNELENTRVANDETMAKGIALAKHYQAMGDDLKASELYVDLAKKATEAGRTVQALSLMRRTTPEGMLMSTMREVESYNDKMKDKPNKQINITPEQRAEFLGKLREAYAMPEGNLKEIRARRIAIGEAIREVRDQIPSSKWDKFTTLWKAGLLTAPTTHIRNIAGNVINGGSEKFAQTVGSGFDWAIGKGTGKRTLTLNGFGGMLNGIKEGSGYAKDIMKTGIDTTGEIDSKWRDQRTNYGNGLGGKLAQGYTDFVFNSLNASDKIFRGSAEKMSIANQAKAIAINEKLKGAERKARIQQLINNPTNAMLENAKYDADMATFQQDTGLGQLVAKGRQVGGVTKKATDIIMPFTGVPSAVADQLVNYSPLGLAKGVKQVADLRKAVKNGLDDSTITALQRKASTQLGRGITGTVLLGAGLALANAGLLSGQPRDEDEKRQWAAEGKKANALKIGDAWIPIDTLSPQMILAAAGANAQSRIENGQNILSTGLNTLSDGVKSWTEQGYMTGVKDAINTLTGDKDFNKYAIQQATSLIPNGIRKLAAATDDKARQADYGNLGESIQNAIPLWRNGLPAKYDIYGREIKTNPFSTLLDPQKSSAENPTDLSKKINEFRKNNPELDSVIPKTAPNKITINGQTRELTSSERSEYQRLLGENISKYMMSGGFNDASFKQLSEGDKKDMLEKIQSDVKKSVEMALFNKTSKQTNDNAKKIAQNIVNGGKNDLNPEWKTKEQSKDELYKKPELEYERLQAEYDKKKKNGDFDGRKVQELQERMKVRKAEIGKDTPKSYRDMYSLSKQSFNIMLKEMDGEQERNEAMTKVLEYGDKLVNAGLEKKNKFRDKYGNVDFEDSKDKKGKSAKVSASSVGTADITGTLSKNLLKTRGSQAKALSAMPIISVRNSGLQARAKRSAVRFKK